MAWAHSLLELMACADFLLGVFRSPRWIAMRLPPSPSPLFVCSVQMKSARRVKWAVQLVGSNSCKELVP